MPEDSKPSAFLAALGNGTLGHALDFDDECETWNSHPTTVIFPAVLALGEKSGTAGRDMLVSYIVGWEVAARIGAVVYPMMYERAGHPTPAVGTLAAAAASSRAPQAKHSANPKGVWDRCHPSYRTTSQSWNGYQALHAGLAASNGVRSAQLASLGFTANENVFDDPIGYLMAAGGKNCKTPDLAGLGYIL